MFYNKNTTFFYAPYREGLNMDDILHEQQDISNAIINYKQDYQKLLTHTGKYSGDIVDENGNINRKKTLKDAVKNDIQTLLIQENTMNIIGIITTASLIVFAIFISK